MSTVKEIGGLLFAIAFFGGMTVGSIAAVVAGIWLVATAPWILFGIPVACSLSGFGMPPHPVVTGSALTPIPIQSTTDRPRHAFTAGMQIPAVTGLPSPLRGAPHEHDQSRAIIG